LIITEMCWGSNLILVTISVKHVSAESRPALNILETSFKSVSEVPKHHWCFSPECMDQNHVPYHLANPQYLMLYYNPSRGSIC
jgi:hypothetical protein